MSSDRNGRRLPAVDRRCEHARRRGEERDREVEALRAKYAPKMAALEDKIRQARERLLDVAAEELEIAPEDLEIVDGAVQPVGVPAKANSAPLAANGNGGQRIDARRFGRDGNGDIALAANWHVRECLLGALLGIVIGLVFAWVLVQALSDQGIEEFRAAPVQLVFIFLLAAIFGVLAAIWPARRASKLDVLHAISTE